MHKADILVIINLERCCRLVSYSSSVSIIMYILAELELYRILLRISERTKNTPSPLKSFGPEYLYFSHKLEVSGGC